MDSELVPKQDSGVGKLTKKGTSLAVNLTANPAE